MAKKHIKIKFLNFWAGFNPADNYFYNLLKEYYDLELTDEPDYLIYTMLHKYPPIGPFKFWNRGYRQYKCIRIYYTGENARPNFNECDYAFTFDFNDNPNHYRLPIYFDRVKPEQLIKKDVDYERVFDEKTKFCNFVYSNWRARKRYSFFKKLSKYKKVDSGGRFKNNLGYIVQDKMAFLKDYKFTIAFENESYPGYTTEKIVQPMAAYSLPIYWGNPLVCRDFNTKSFLNYYDFKNENELIERIIELDNNKDLYIKYLKEPYFHNNEINDYMNPQKLLKQFDYIFNNDKEPVALKGKKTIFIKS